jgi:transcriptional antiterminator NusG
MADVSKRAELGLNCNHDGLRWTGDEAVGDAWYAVCTRSNYEFRIARDLQAREISHYLPGASAQRKWKDRKKEVFVPLFPGYLFTRFADTPSNRLNVLKIPGVVRFLSVGSALQPIPEYEIESVQRLFLNRVSLLCHPFLREGCWVRVRRGALEGLEGRLVRYRNSTRLVISIDVLARSVATELDAADVETIERL